MITLLDILVVAAVLGFAFWGWLVGLRAASIAALEFIACLVLAILLHESLVGFLRSATAMLFGDALPQAWAVPLAFAILAWGPFAVLRLRGHQEREEEDATEIDPLLDRVMGAVAGGLGGGMVVGGMLVTISLVPFLAGLKPSGDRMLLDVGKTALRTAGQFVLERHEGRSLPLWGEPASRKSIPSARLTSEPWFDDDDDGTFTEADRYRDVDGNGTFSKDLYFEDVDGDGLRRIGLIDKYVVGRWDDMLQSNDRPRQDMVKPAASQTGQSPEATVKPDQPPPAQPQPKPLPKPKPQPKPQPKPKPGDRESPPPVDDF